MSVNAQEFVYTLRDHYSRPVYVGRSRNVARRIQEHYWNRLKAPWILDVHDVTMSGPYDHDVAVWVESCRIWDLSPPANKAHNAAYSSGIPGYNGGRYSVREVDWVRDFILDESRPYQPAP